MGECGNPPDRRVRLDHSASPTRELLGAIQPRRGGTTVAWATGESLGLSHDSIVAHRPTMRHSDHQLAVRRRLPGPSAEVSTSPAASTSGRPRSGTWPSSLHYWVVPVVRTCSVDRDFEASEGISNVSECLCRFTIAHGFRVALYRVLGIVDCCDLLFDRPTGSDPRAGVELPSGVRGNQVHGDRHHRAVDPRVPRVVRGAASALGLIPPQIPPRRDVAAGSSHHERH